MPRGAWQPCVCVFHKHARAPAAPCAQETKEQRPALLTTRPRGSIQCAAAAAAHMRVAPCAQASRRISHAEMMNPGEEGSSEQARTSRPDDQGIGKTRAKGQHGGVRQRMVPFPGIINSGGGSPSSPSSPPPPAVRLLSARSRRPANALLQSAAWAPIDVRAGRT